MSIYHFGPEEIRKGQLDWQLEDAEGNRIAKGNLKHGNIPVSTVDSLGVVNISLEKVAKAGKYTFKVQIAEGIRNEWDIWVYPEPQSTNSYKYVRQWGEAKKLLEQGENVFFIPDSCAGRKTHFASHFWNPIMFNWEPMIVGTYIADKHPAFQNFPTSYYADWQWWDILNEATAVDLTAMRTLTPIIQSIDTYEVNRKLGIAFEANAGKGKLFVLCVNPEKNKEERLAMRQLLTSVQEYVTSAQFNPEVTLPLHELDALFMMNGMQQKNVRSNEAVKQLLNQ